MNVSLTIHSRRSARAHSSTLFIGLEVHQETSAVAEALATCRAALLPTPASGCYAHVPSRATEKISALAEHHGPSPHRLKARRSGTAALPPRYGTSPNKLTMPSPASADPDAFGYGNGISQKWLASTRSGLFDLAL